MKKFLSFVLSLVTLVSLAQNPSMQWEKSYKGTLSGSDIVTCSSRDNFSINYVCGYNSDYTFILKIDNTGALTQTIEYVDQYNNEIIPQSIFVDNSSNIYVVSKSGNVLKFNSAGALLWENQNTTYATISVEAATTDNVSTPNYIYYTGSFNTFAGIIKVNTSTGATTWEKYFNPSGNTYSKAYDIIHNSGNVYFTGVTNNGTGEAAYTVKVNSLGTTSYQYIGSFGISETSLRLEVNTSGDAFVFGKTSSTGREEVYLRKINNAGVVSWTNITDHTAPNDISNITAVDLAANPSYTAFFMVYKAIPPPNTFINSLCEFTFGVNSSGVSTMNNSNTSFYPQPTRVKSDNVGNFYVLGTINSGSRVMYATKYNTSLFSQFISNYTLVASGAGTPNATDLPNEINFDNSGNFYVSGTGIFNSLNYRDAILVKFNQSGNNVWDNQYDGMQNAKDYSNKVFLTESKANLLSVGSIQNNFTKKDVIVKMHDLQGNEIWSSLLDIDLKTDELANSGKDLENNVYIQFTNDTVNNYLAVLDSLGTQLSSVSLPYKSTGFFVSKTNTEVFAGNNNLLNADIFEIRGFLKNGNASFIAAGNSVAGFKTSCNDIWQDATGNVYACGTITNTGTNAKTIQVQKFNPAGVMQWVQTIPNLSISNESKSFVRINASGQIICLANAQTTTGATDAVVATTYDASGNMINQYIHGGTANDPMKLEGAKVSGDDIYFYGSKGTGTGTLYQGMVVKLNSIPSLVWEKEFTTSVVNFKDDKVYDITFDNTNLLVAGTKYVNSTLTNAFLSKLDTNSNTIWEETPASNYAGENKFYSVAANQSRVYTSGTINESKGFNGDYAVYKYCDNTVPVVLNSGSNIVCSNQNSVLTSSISSASYLWSPGNQTTQSINITQTGSYFVTNIESDGCERISDTLTISIKPAPSAPSICMVTVDSLSTHNIVIWDKSPYTDADHFRIYREDFTNIYSLVGLVPYDSLSEFHDLSANPNVTTKRYKLSAVDTCGQESVMSNYHNTLYIAYVGNGQYLWNPLYTIENSPNPVTQYVLMRDDNSTGVWNQVATTAGTQNTLTDPAFASFPNGKWRVETSWSISCLATRGAINTSRSNIKAPTSLIGIHDNDFLAGGIQIYPNPSVGLITIESSLFTEKTAVTIYNVLGELVYNTSFNGTKNQLDLKELSSGVYTVNISTNNQQVIKKIVLEN